MDARNKSGHDDLGVGHDDTVAGHDDTVAGQGSGARVTNGARCGVGGPAAKGLDKRCRCCHASALPQGDEPDAR